MRSLAVLLVAALLTSCGPTTGGLVAEDALRQQFHTHQAAITQILEMQEHDSRVVRIAPTFTRLDTDWSWPRKEIGLSAQRWNRYRALFKEAGISDGVQSDSGYVFFFVSSQGLAIGGTSRGFVHIDKAVAPVVDKFDDCPHLEGICYILLAKNWYLFQWTT